MTRGTVHEKGCLWAIWAWGAKRVEGAAVVLSKPLKPNRRLINAQDEYLSAVGTYSYKL